MSAVTLLAAGAKADTGTGAAVDVSAGSTLRLDAALKFGGAANTVITVWIETAPSAASATWRGLYAKTFIANPVSSSPWPMGGVERISLSSFDSFARVRWSGQAGNVSNNSPTDSTAGFDLTVSGTLT